MSHKPQVLVVQRLDAPAFGALVTVPADVRVRIVYGSVKLAGQGNDAASVSAEVETGTDADRYEVVFEEHVSMRSASEATRSFCFAVAGGRRYRFTAGGEGGASESVAHYSFADL